MSVVAAAAPAMMQMQQQIFHSRASTSTEILSSSPPNNIQPIPSQQQQQESSEQSARKDLENLHSHGGTSGFSRQPYRFKTSNVKPHDDIQEGPGRRLRKNVANVRKHIDYVANVLNHMEARLWQHSRRDRAIIQPDILYHTMVLPPASTPETPVDCVLTKFVRSAMNKVKCPIYSLCWTPEGKRLITGASSGEFTLWNGTAFNFETILQAHDVAIRSMKWSHNDQWLASADHDGFVKYWQPNFNNVHMFQAHKDEPVRSLSFCPTDVKLATGSDDGTARVWDFARCIEERVLRGHGADVRAVDWHPQKGLLATGSRDSQQPVKLWDAKTGQCLATLHDHKNSVMAVQWNRNGNWLLTGSRDHVIKLYDVRMMREMHTYKGHKKEVTALAWHPIHEGLFVSGGGDGSIGYWLVNGDREMAMLEQAHDMAIWTLEWHPLGHILATGSNDNNTKFWSRNRPGDTQEDVFGMTTVGGVLTSASMVTAGGDEDREAMATEEQLMPVIPGLGIDDTLRKEMNRDVTTIPPLMSLPGLGSMDATDSAGPGRRQQQGRQAHQQPKKSQRQFERMWIVARPGGGGNDYPHNQPSGGMFDMPGLANDDIMMDGPVPSLQPQSLFYNSGPPFPHQGPPQNNINMNIRRGFPPSQPSAGPRFF